MTFFQPGFASIKISQEKLEFKLDSTAIMSTKSPRGRVAAGCIDKLRRPE
jgi:hypothetical protein